MKRERSRTIFDDRADAGRALAEHLRAYAGRRDVVVVGLPRGGVPVAAVVARALGAPLEVWMVRKLGVPGHSEFAMGAIASGGVVEVDKPVVEMLGITSTAVEQVIQSERVELERRERTYRRDRPALDLASKTLIVVDDGIATGWTMRAVIRSLRDQEPAEVVVATPVASRQACMELEQLADDCVCAHCPMDLYAVGFHYWDFAPTTDEEVVRCLDSARERVGHVEPGAPA